jgi:proteic killer suppression protein
MARGVGLIDISWAKGKLEKACSDERRGAQAWGPEHWKLIKRRLASLLAAPTLEDMEGVPGSCHALRGDRKGQFAVSLWGSYRLVFELDHNPTPRLEDGGIDRSKITRIVIKEVVDYHGD